MKIYLSLIIFIFSITLSLKAQQTSSLEASTTYVQDYYSTYETGYDFDGTYVVISNNYKATFCDTIFTLTFDAIDENKNLQKQSVTIHLNDVISIEPNGTDIVEIFGDTPLVVPLCGKLAFFTNTEIYEINIYYEVDANVEDSEIYKSFNQLIETYKN
jgi:hypothetical protein